MDIYTCAVSKRKPAVHVQDVPAPEGRKTPLAFLAQVTAEPGPNIQPSLSCSAAICAEDVDLSRGLLLWILV